MAKKNRIHISKAELLEHLKEQLSFLLESCKGFDSGSLACALDCSLDTSSCSSDDGGGGGGGITITPVTKVNFSGRAYPNSEVTLLKDGQIASVITAGTNAAFSTSLSGLSAGNYNFVIYSEDKQGRRSALFSFPTYVVSGSTTNVSGIFLAPTIALDKSEVKSIRYRGWIFKLMLTLFVI